MNPIAAIIFPLGSLFLFYLTYFKRKRLNPNEETTNESNLIIKKGKVFIILDKKEMGIVKKYLKRAWCNNICSNIV